jgi:hypothetical protein
MRRIAVLVALAFAAGAGPARAAYDPHLDVRVDPPAPGAPASLTATVTQAPGESATRSERVRIPAQFAFNPGLRVSRCHTADERAGDCPDDSRIGAAEAQTMLGHFAGPVYLTADFRFVVFLRGLGGLVQQEVAGYLLLEPDGSVQSVLDGLPDVPATLARVTFDSGPRSLFLTPRACGRYVLDAQFTSHDGERAARRSTVQIAGCDSTPRIEQAAATQRGARRVRVAWRLSDTGAATIVELDRLVRGRRFDRWRRERRIRAAAARGANHATVGLSKGGRYQIVLRSLSARGRPADVARVLFTVRLRRRPGADR